MAIIEDVTSHKTAKIDAPASITSAHSAMAVHSALNSLETGGHLEEAADHLHSIDGKITTCNTGAVAGSVTANAGTNLNTSALALDATLVLLRKALAPSLGTVVYMAISGTSADSGTIATAGTYELSADVSCWVRVNAATAGSAAVVETAPAVLVSAGERFQVAVGTNGAIVAITSGGAGVLGYQLVS